MSWRGLRPQGRRGRPVRLRHQEPDDRLPQGGLPAHLRARGRGHGGRGVVRGHRVRARPAHLRLSRGALPEVRLLPCRPPRALHRRRVVHHTSRRFRPVHRLHGQTGGARRHLHPARGRRPGAREPGRAAVEHLRVRREHQRAARRHRGDPRSRPDRRLPGGPVEDARRLEDHPHRRGPGASGQVLGLRHRPTASTRTRSTPSRRSSASPAAWAPTRRSRPIRRRPDSSRRWP